MPAYVFENLHYEGDWLSPATVQVNREGMITAVESGIQDPNAPQVSGLALPGMANLHSHAFQRAMIGLTEFRSSKSSDSFWTWRERMYQVALSMSPEALEAVAAQLYLEMLLEGFTAVGEFHYLHHDLDGQPYPSASQMSDRIFSAAQRTGIALTHLPVLYLRGGFGKPATPEQRRFTHDQVSDFLRLFEILKANISDPATQRLGVAPHSLRAVNVDDLGELVSALSPEIPIHIHIAEQIKEVQEAEAFLGARPVQWLFNNFDVDSRWCLVHATHLDAAEVSLLAQSDAVAGLCPTTEANLGDGIFPADHFLEQGGTLGIGTDSQVNVSVNDELRLLEYGQRLKHWQRNVLVSSEQASVGRHLFDSALRGGAQALAQPIGRIAPGLRADIVVLDLKHPRLAAQPLRSVLDAWIFGHARGAVRDVMVAGRWVIENGVHAEAESIFQAYEKAVRQLWA